MHCLDRSAASTVEDPVDHKPEMDEACKPKCNSFIKAYEARPYLT